MGLQPIPTAWRQKVCAALRQGSRAARFTAEGGQRWQNEFPDAFRYELDEALLQFLFAPSAHGCPVTMDHPPGETWEFFFRFRDEKLYGKLLLKKSDGKSVIIFSAHRPDRPRLRCG
ncbi:hypothetical protein [Opitutus terrae]|uniref:Uncharacterized protein n=1 Tax=Opitutus terrae (strain DSM 11246 / JCM 15787 / PB90-1) TaxID=452637 RepID=B1ZSG2_OPITP|nr:hypothetical protein [Opitutus terrae]ACB73819.1 hypothetical protein Oter_0529 [Opitutus terrae PB90-1]